MKKAFTLVEVLIVVAILGILSALTAPLVKGYVLSSKESVAKANLQTLRTAIQRYAVEHNDVPPGYPKNNINNSPNWLDFFQQLTWNKYINTIPANPFNKSAVVKLVGTNGFPAQALGNNGYLYNPPTREIRLNWPGKDSKGVRYYDY